MTTSRQKNVEDLYPLSPMQQGMLFHTLYAPGSGVYVEQVSCTLHGDLNVPAFEQAWRQVVDRHPVLRSGFVWEDLDEPLQVVRQRVKLPWERHDWRAYAPDEQRERLAAFLQADRARGFKLSKAPLMRLALIQLAEDTYRFVWSHHHLLLDGWSLPLVLKEVFVVYEAHCRGQEPLLERSRPYRDYVEWLRRQPLHEAEAFWRQMLAEFSAPTPLVVERGPAARDEAQTYRTAQARLSEATTAELHGLARAEQITLSTLVQGAWAMLLSRYSGMADVVFGLTVSGRPADLAGVETMVGLFINTLPLRVHVAAADAARPWLKRLQARQFELRQYEYTPLVQVQSWSSVPRGQPLFESIVVFENYPVDEALGQRAGGVEIRDVCAVEQTNYPLALLALASAGLTLQAIYDGHRFDAAAITRMLGHLQTLLDGIATGPERRLADLSLLTAAERQQALFEWNATRTAYSTDRCIHELFEQQVELSPDAVAVIFDQRPTTNDQRPSVHPLTPSPPHPFTCQQLTYRELNEWSNRLARQLRALEVGPGGLVAIYMDRVAAMVPALLGILKAGGAYVPLEPSFPEARVRWILASLQVRCVVTQAVYTPLLRGLQLPALEHLICLDDDRQSAPGAAGLRVWTNADLERLPATNPPAGAGPDDLAYIVFTSGSTGTPKGVMIQHRPVINLIDWVNRTFALGPSDQVLFITSLCFDLSVYDVFGLLAAGGSIRLASDGDIRDPQRLARMLREEPITFWDSAPAALQQLIPFFAPAPGDAPWLRLIFLSGDWIPLALPDLVRASFPRAQVIGLGGGTEATVWSNYYPIGVVEPHWVSIPYGKPIQNAAYYILDAHLNPCPIGVPGDLYIGGECLSSGYAGDPAQTAERFLPNPFAEVLGVGCWVTGEESSNTQHPTPNTRLYRTGDQARFWADGTMEFLGRVDHQVKIRGYRIELGEIEAALVQHPAVREAVVLAREDVPGEKRLVAYVVPKIEDRGLKIEDSGSEAPDPLSSILYPLSSELRRFLQKTLPAYMVPSAFLFLDALPLTPNGKLDRRALPAPEALRPALETAYALPQTRIEQAIAAVWQMALHVEKVGIYDNFFDLGGHSILMVRVQGMLREALKQELGDEVELSMIDLFQYPTIHALATYLGGEQRPPAALERGAQAEQPRVDRPARPQAPVEDIAIVGMAGRFPGAGDVDAFWRNLRDGVESITFFSDEELAAVGVDPLLLKHPSYVKATGVLEDSELFDASFFGVTPREAEIMDPQHRIFLECAWAALEHAGYDPERFDGPIGVYAGDSPTTYLLFNLQSRPDVIDAVGAFQIAFGNDKDYLSTRVSYKLNLRGPSLTVQTACSTSLVALHLACQSLWNGECDMALAGGVGVRVPLKGGYLYQEGGIASPDGHCRAFDARAAGIVGGNGVGALVVKRLADALADGDTIYAVVKGSAVNNDGAQKVGYTAPGVDGQIEVVARALAIAQVDPESIGYVEAHGTGTALGDPIEVAALTRAFRAATAKRGFCALGSVKTNIGHLDAAAGVASVIKTVLAFQHRQIPPSLHFETPNPKIDFASSPFYVNTALADWPAGAGPRRAGVSAFGIGGTNAHIILEEAPAPQPTSAGRPWQLLVLSATTASALERMTANLAAHLRQHPELDLADLAYTLQVGRKAFGQRRTLVCRGRDDALAALETGDPQRVATHTQERRDRPVVFMFPGQGAQYPQMARDLYEHEPVFREVVDRCAELLMPQLGLDLRTILYPDLKIEDRRWRIEDTESSILYPLSSILDLNQTWLTQPALFVIEYALARLWMSWGVRPQAMIGHSIGEYVAACLAGVFSLEDALALVAARGRLMQDMPGGAMVSVYLPEHELRPLLDADLALAAVNGPALCVLSGPLAAVEAAERRLAARGVETRRLHTWHAFHSSMMEPILEPFRARVRQIALHPPTIPYLSNVTGTWITAAQATDPDYWARQLRQTVRFADGAAELLREPGRVLLEVGPGHTLGTFVRQLDPAGPLALASLRHPHDRQPDLATLLTTLGRLWLVGVAVDWPQLYADQRRRRVPLPSYPFERQRYWVDPGSAQTPASTLYDAFRKKPDIADWFYLPVWKHAVPPLPVAPRMLAEQPTCWLVLRDDCAVGDALASRLEQAGQEVIVVSAGARFDTTGERSYTLDPRRAADYDALIRELRARDKTPQVIVHLWSVTAGEPAQPEPAHFEAAQDRGFYSLILLAQALGSQCPSDRIQLIVVTSDMQEVIGEDLRCPEKATVLGPCKVIPQEYPNISCRSVDVELGRGGDQRAARLADQLLAECVAGSQDTAIAYRRNYRWVQTFDPLRHDESLVLQPRLRAEGVYLITGGLGSLGLLLAQHLAQTVRAKLVLVGRSALPPREEWERWLARHDERDRVSRTLRRVQALEALGAEVLVIGADVARADQMQEAIHRTYECFGALHGVIHAAGVVGEKALRLVQEADRADGEAQFQAKAHGLLVLEDVLRGREIDFCLLFSSLGSVLGGLGFVVYAAANSFMDAFARWHNQAGAVPWISVNWDAWQPDEEPQQSPTIGAALMEMAMSPAEGAAAFERALALGALPQVVVSTADLAARVAAWVQSRSEREAAARSGDTLSLHPRPNLLNAYVAPTGEVEQRIAAIWQELLGIEQVGLHDNFFELGGHSLLATQVISRLRDAFQAAVSLRQLFETPTVAGLAAALTQDVQPDGRPEAEAIGQDAGQQLLANLDQLSDEDVSALLATMLENREGTP